MLLMYTVLQIVLFFSIVIAFFYHSNKKMFEFKLAFMLHVMYVINHILDIVDKWSYVS